MALIGTNCILLPTTWCFCYTILAKNCADCKMTLNFHITTDVNEDFFLAAIGESDGMLFRK